MSACKPESGAVFGHARSLAVDESALPLSVPRIGGYVGLLELVTFGFGAGVTFASMVHALLLQKRRR